MLEFSHSKKLYYPLFDLLQTIMIIIKNALGLLNIQCICGGGLPRQVQDPFQVGSRNGILR